MFADVSYRDGTIHSFFQNDSEENNLLIGKAKTIVQVVESIARPFLVTVEVFTELAVFAGLQYVLKGFEQGLTSVCVTVGFHLD